MIRARTNGVAWRRPGTNLVELTCRQTGIIIKAGFDMNLFSRTSRFFFTLLAVAGLVANSALAEICLMPCGQDEPQAAVSCCDSKPAPAAKAAHHCALGQEQPAQAPVVASPSSATSKICACDHRATFAVVSIAAPEFTGGAQALVSCLPNFWQSASLDTAVNSSAPCDSSQWGSPPAFVEHCSFLC